MTAPGALNRHCRDQSIYRRTPQAVVVPSDVDDVVKTLAFCREEGISLTCRGGGSGTAGAALGTGIVLAFERDGSMGDLRICNGGDGTPRAECGPAVLHDRMQERLLEHGRFCPADPSSGSMCLIGGNVATKASGPHALRHGSIDRYLDSLECVLVDGTRIDTARPDTIPEGLAKGILAIGETVRSNPRMRRDLQRRRGRKIASGYNLFPFLDGDASPAQLLTCALAGSVGTLAVVTKARLRSEAKSEGCAAMLLFFEHLRDAGRAVDVLLQADPAAIEIMNARSLGIIRQVRSGLTAGLPDCDAHMLLTEFTGAGVQDQIRLAESRLRSNGLALACAPEIVTDAEGVSRLWKLRKALLPAVRGYSRTHRPFSVVNDVGVPTNALASFIADVEQVFDDLGMPAAIYGHAGSGNLHLRPLFDLTHRDLPRLIEHTAERIYERVLAYDGTITAEHGMGPIRAPFLRREWGDELYAAMRDLKRLLDPEDVLNPHAMFSDRPITDGAFLQ